MQYRQNSKINSSSSEKVSSSGVKSEQIKYDKEITQQWKIKTDDPSQLLPYCLQHLYLSRKCQFWHQMKFFYFQNYDQMIQKTNHQEIIETQANESTPQFELSISKLQNCKKLSKVLWKITRHRLMYSMKKIKQEAQFQQQQSSDLSIQNLDSYMRFLKLGQNRMESAIQNLDSFLQRNVRRKLLQGLLKIKSQEKRKKNYQDHIKIQCFIQICHRAIKKDSKRILYGCFSELIEYNETLKIQQERLQLQLRQKQKREQQKRKRDQQSRIYKSVSNKKNRQEEQTRQKKQNQEKRWIKEYNAVTKKKEIQQNLISSSKFINHQSNIKSVNNQKIYLSEYYYEDEGQEENLIQEDQEDIRIKMNQKPTARPVYNQISSNHSSHVDNHYQNNHLIHKNINQRKKFINDYQNFRETGYNSHQIHRSPPTSSQFKHGSYPTTHYHRDHTDSLHIPITQRIQRNNQQYEQQQIVIEQSSSSVTQQENIQQIYIIRNHNERPKRKPDQFIKVPIISSNINLVQIPAGNRSQRAHFEANLNVHSNSYYERKTCQNCFYCQKLKKVSQFVSQVNREISFAKKDIMQQHVIQTVVSKQIVIIENQDSRHKKNQQQIKLSENKNKDFHISINTQNNEEEKNIKESIQILKSGGKISRTVGKSQNSEYIQETKNNSRGKSTQRKLITRKPLH